MKTIFTIFLALFFCRSYAQSDFEEDSLKSEKIIRELLKTQKEMIHNDTITFTKGRLFQSNLQHKLIRYSNEGLTIIKVYSEKNNFKEPIFNYNILSINYISDSIFDINGDNDKDISIHWYPSSGCCLADIFDCYFYNKSTDSFSIKNKILNPTFYPKDSLVYSMDYKHPGETIFIKIKWEAFTQDTINTYSWNNKKQEYVIITNHKTGEIKKCIKFPNELIGLKGIDWFEMKNYNQSEE